MKFAISTISLALATLASAQWTCDSGFQCGSTILSRDTSDFWIRNLKNAETLAGREGKDPLWDLFRCSGNRTVSLVQHCPGRCSYTGNAGEDRCDSIDGGH
ncbi:hypothetical protein GGI43DRAFT_406701 [Trichoderma evansii]